MAAAAAEHERSAGEEAQDRNDLPIATRIGWGIGSFPMSAINLAASPLLIRYMTDTLGVAAALAGTLFSVARIWNAVADPIVGALSDRVHSRWGRRLPCMLAGGLGSAAVLVLTYTAPVGDALLPAFLLLMMLLYASTYTLFMVPYLAMPAEITSSYHGRSQLMSIRVVFNSAGSFVGAGLAPMMLSWWGATRVGHLKMACVIAGTSAAMVLLCVWLLRNAPRSYASPSRQRTSLLLSLGSALAIPPFAWLLLSKVLYFLTLAFTLTALPFFTKHVMKTSDAWLGTILVCQTAALIASQPFWLKVARTFDKRTGYILAALLYAITYASYWFAGPHEPIAVTLVRAAVGGFAGGGTFLLTQAMLPDVMEYDKITHGEPREGMLAGVFIMVEQIAGAFGVAMFGWVLGAFNYKAGVEGLRVTQPAEAISALRYCVTLVPAGFILLSIVSISRYRLSRKTLERLRAAARGDLHEERGL